MRMLEMSGDYLWRCLFCSFSLNLVFKRFILTSLPSGELDKDIVCSPSCSFDDQRGKWQSHLVPGDSPSWNSASCFLPLALHPFVVHNFSNVCIGTHGKMGWSYFLKWNTSKTNSSLQNWPLRTLSVTSSCDARCRCTSLSCAATEPWKLTASTPSGKGLTMWK